MRRRKKIFQREYAKRLESEGQKQTRQRLQKVVTFFGKTTNLVFLLAASVLVSLVWQQRIANPYLASPRAVGGDYFSALTFANFFARHLPFPPTGWLPFWFEGIPIIGGYPVFFFYLMLPLTRFFDVPTSMELTSIVLLLLYLIAAHFLFWEVTRSHAIALLFTGIIIVTPATYYSLVAEGLFVGSAMQWCLPVAFFFLVRFLKFQERSTLVAASLATGIALTTHPAVAVLTILIPAYLFLLIADTGDPKDATHTQQLRLLKLSFWERLKTKATHLGLFTALALASGSTGVYTLILQTFFSGGAGPCESQQCWGEYPQHFIWFSPLILLPIVFLPGTLIAWRIHKARLREAAAPIAALSPLLVYVALAYLHKIDTLASALFPRRLFWAIVLLFLMSSGVAFRYTLKASTKLAITTLSIFLVLLSLSIPLLPKAVTFSLRDHLKIPNSLPMAVENYIVPKYQTLPTSEIIPPWLPLNDVSWRMDSIRPDFFVWWNAIAQMPSTRGYSNAPTKEHLDWLYYLQTSTLIPSNPDELSIETRKNRALFLLDAFAIRFLQHPGGSIVYTGVAYDPLLLTDRALIKKSQRVREWTFIELSEKFITPIVSPTNAARVLIISNQQGYETLVRAISLENLNSQMLLPIQGPQSIDAVRPSLLTDVDAVILYQFRGNRWNHLEAFVANGGKLFLDIGSLENLPPTVPELFGAKSLQVFDQERLWKLKVPTSSKLLQGVDSNLFSPLMFEENPWRIIAPASNQFLKDWMQPILMQNDAPIITSGTFGKGVVIFSGFNLPYHIVSYQNEEEAKLLKNIVLSLTGESNSVGEYSLKHPKPTSISMVVTNTKGVYFKQNFHPGWKAIVNGKRTKVYKAGLEFMYIPIPPESWGQTSHISLDFQGSAITWGLPILSAAAIVLGALYGLTSAPFRLLRRLSQKLIFKHVTDWWARE